MTISSMANVRLQRPLTISPKVNMPTNVRPQRPALTFSPNQNIPTNVHPQRVALTVSPTVNMPKGMLRIK
jgi:hypothetical protein